jgi:hypothetical protein
MMGFSCFKWFFGTGEGSERKAGKEQSLRRKMSERNIDDRRKRGSSFPLSSFVR